jgi:hypothetical protein
MEWHRLVLSISGFSYDRPSMNRTASCPSITRQLALALPPPWPKSRAKCTHFYETFISRASISHGTLMLTCATSHWGIHLRRVVTLKAIKEQLHRGDRWWIAELILRTAGLGVLAVCALMARTVYRLINQPPAHDGTPLEFIVAATTVVSLWAGLALLFEGPGLFRPVPKPPRALF